MKNTMEFTLLPTYNKYNTSLCSLLHAFINHVYILVSIDCSNGIKFSFNKIIKCDFASMLRTFVIGNHSFVTAINDAVTRFKAFASMFFYFSNGEIIIVITQKAISTSVCLFTIASNRFEYYQNDFVPSKNAIAITKDVFAKSEYELADKKTDLVSKANPMQVGIPIIREPKIPMNSFSYL